MKCPHKCNRKECTEQRYEYNEDGQLERDVFTTVSTETLCECETDCAAYKDGVCQFTIMNLQK